MNSHISNENIFKKGSNPAKPILFGNAVLQSVYGQPREVDVILIWIRKENVEFS